MVISARTKVALANASLCLGASRNADETPPQKTNSHAALGRWARLPGDGAIGWSDERATEGWGGGLDFQARLDNGKGYPRETPGGPLTTPRMPTKVSEK